MNCSETAAYVAEMHETNLPDEIEHQLRKLLLDFIGSWALGGLTNATTFSKTLADSYLATKGQQVGILGEVFAHATRANAVDIDDGYRLVKGHPGALVNPVAMVCQKQQGTMRELLKSMWAGYEVGMRVGQVFHAEYAEYHCSGSWGALAAAATASYALSLTPQEIDHALGIAEYHAPIGIMMRCIASPAMVKDGIGWGAMTGTAAALLAKEGFTGIPHLLHPEAPLSVRGQKTRDVLPLWNESLLPRVYIKPYACCRWAQPAVEAILHLRRTAYSRSSAEIETIHVETFSEATQLNTVWPETTEAAQYSLPWAVASAWRWGDVGIKQIDDNALHDDLVRTLAQRVHMRCDPELDREFPERTLARVRIQWTDGPQLTSTIFQAPGEEGSVPYGWTDVETKFLKLVEPIWKNTARKLATFVRECDPTTPVTALWQLLQPIEQGREQRL